MVDSYAPSGFVSEELSRSVWNYPKHYTDFKSIGQGAYGAVCSATNTLLNTKCAVKKLQKPFQTNIHAKRTYRELVLLCHMRHENVISLVDVFTPDSCAESLSDVYLVTHLMGADLNSIIKSQWLTDEHVQFLLYQILRGIKYLHSAGIIHRDLKPSNIAVNENCELKILDFGLARVTDDELTGYVATRWYRAPEIMLSWQHYGKEVDIWSVGCIFAELLTRKTLFPGDDHINQLRLIIELCGTPNDDFLNRIEGESAKNYIKNQIPQFNRKNFSQYFVNANYSGLDLMDRMLIIDPSMRINAEAALEHQYLEDYHDPDDEPISEEFDDSFEKTQHNLSTWKEMIWEEIHRFRARNEEMDM